DRRRHARPGGSEGRTAEGRVSRGHPPAGSNPVRRAGVPAGRRSRAAAVDRRGQAARAISRIGAGSHFVPCGCGGPAVVSGLGCDGPRGPPSSLHLPRVSRPDGKETAPMALTLYFHPLSSFCHKALIALYENGTPFAGQVVNFGDADSRARFLALW